MSTRGVCLVFSFLFALQLCAAGRSQTLLAWCSLLIGLRPMTRGRTASGASMWKRTRGSCLTSKCKRRLFRCKTEKSHREVGGGACQTDLQLAVRPEHTPGTHPRGFLSIYSLSHTDKPRRAHGGSVSVVAAAN